MQLTIGTIIMMDKDYSKDSEKYKSKVVETGEDYIMIDFPSNVKTGRTAFFLDGTQLLVSFTNQLKISYAFKTEVLGRQNKEIPMLKLSYPGDDQLIKVQRREFVRVETPVDIAVLTVDGTFQLVADDISAGGVAIRLPATIPVKERDVIKLVLVLPYANKEIKYCKAEGEIIRIWEKDRKRIASVQFKEIDMLDRQNIVRFCFERQLRNRAQ